MSTVAAALPDYHGRSYQHQQPFPHQFPAPATQNQPIMYQYQQPPQFPNQPANAYNHSFVPHYPPQFTHSHQSRHQQTAFPQFMTGQIAPHGSQNMMNQTIMMQQPIQQHLIPGQFSQPYPNPLFTTSYTGRMGAAYQGLPGLHIDGSLSQAQGQNHLPSQSTHGTLFSHMDTTFANIRSHQTNHLELLFKDLCPSGTAPKTQAVWPCPMGWQFTTLDPYHRSQGPLLQRGDCRY